MIITVRNAGNADVGQLDGVMSEAMGGRSYDERVVRARAVLSEASLVLIAVDSAAATRCNGARAVGAIALSSDEAGGAVVTALAVQAAFRGRGVGRSLVRAAAERCEGGLADETDGAAEGFYRAVGFDVQSLGFLYPDVERFECLLG